MSSKSRREKLNCVPASPPSSKLIFLGRFKQLRRVNMTAVIFWASPLDRMALAIHHYVQPTYRFPIRGSLHIIQRPRRDQDFFFGTFFPFLRALERPMAIACFRLLTLPPLPPRPLLALPRL